RLAVRVPAAARRRSLRASHREAHACQEVPMEEFYWERHPDGPFATLIRVATTYLHPEVDELEALQRLARRDDDEEMRAFKAELRQAVSDPGRVPTGELSRHVQYED